MRLGAALVLVPVIGWTVGPDGRAEAEPLALVLSRPDGVTRLSLVEGLAQRAPDEGAGDALREADRRRLAAAVVELGPGGAVLRRVGWPRPDAQAPDRVLELAVLDGATGTLRRLAADDARRAEG
jgi:hypothetical protein